MKYHRVTYEDRIKINLLLQQGKSNIEIAVAIGKNKSTIGREIKRNSGGRGYRFKQAHNMALKRENEKHSPYKMNRQIETNIKKYLLKRWSPEQIYHRLRKEGEDIVCTESIYKFIYTNKESGGDLWKYLRRAHRKRKHRFPSHEGRGKIQDATPIKKRSTSANKRLRLGDWERDTMIGLDRKTCILALVDRKSRYNKFVKLNRRLAPKITSATCKALKDLPVTSITNDRGLEFADHKNCSDKLHVKVFFCDPYSSSQRGTNENRIGILRQYFPKKTDLKKISSSQIRKVEFEINNRPMKCLDWKTPYEVMFKKSCTRKW